MELGPRVTVIGRGTGETTGGGRAWVTTGGAWVRRGVSRAPGTVVSERPTSAGNGQKLMKLRSSGLCIGSPILPPTEIEENNEEDDDEDAGDTSPETRPVKLKPGGSCRLVDDVV